MLLWIVFAFLTAASLAALLMPLASKKEQGEQAGAFDATVYKDQLEEIESDLSRGIVSPEDAEAARVEISRRLLATAEGDAAQKDGTDSGSNAGFAFVFSAVLVPFLSLGLYLTYGAPGLPDQPLSARLSTPVEQQRIDELIARAEAQLRANPKDGDGWDVVAPIYLRMGRYQDSADAYAKALVLKGESKTRLFGRAEALRLVGDGVVSQKARDLFQKVVKLDPDYVPALYRLAVATEQDGKLGEAVTAWKDIVRRLPEDSDWGRDARRRLQVAEAKLEGKPIPPTEGISGPGPTKEQIEAVRQMSPEDRQAMIDSMVERLAGKLEENGKDLNGWLRLMRAYSALGRQSDAIGALKSARSHFSEDDASLALLSRAAKQLGLDD